MELTKLAGACVLSLFFFGSVSGQTVKCDTIHDFSDHGCSQAIYKAPNGKHYKVKFVDAPMEDALPEFESNTATNCADSLFAGTARKAAKTSIVTAQTEDFATVSAFIKTLATDAVMRTKVNSNSKRVSLENRNVHFSKDTYIFAFKKESDDDYHVIIGDNKDPKKATFFNTEISGLPNTTDKRFISVRDQFEHQFVNVCSGQYAVFSANPIKISMEGSIFFDVDHKPGQIGPPGFQPLTTWEIHPITKIAFLK